MDIYAQIEGQLSKLPSSKYLIAGGTNLTGKSYSLLSAFQEFI